MKQELEVWVDCDLIPLEQRLFMSRAFTPRSW